MICVSIGSISFPELAKLLRSEEFVEIRLDQNDFSDDELRSIFSTLTKTIATCRPGKFKEEERIKKLKLCVESGASFIDIELETMDDSFKEISILAKVQNCNLIISHHNYEETPPISELKKIFRSSQDMGADIVKIACKVTTEKDNAILLSLYHCLEDTDTSQLILIGMGEKGKITRVAAPLLGAPFTYASYEAGKETAQGQITKSEIEEIIKVITDENN